jgi:hypothetical protein
MEDQKIQVSRRKPDIQIQRKDQTSISVPKDENSYQAHKTEEIESHPNRWLFFIKVLKAFMQSCHCNNLTIAKPFLCFY